MAVTRTRLYAFAAHAERMHWRIAERFAAWERDKIAITVHGRVDVRTLEIEDLSTGEKYEFRGAAVGPAHGSVVIRLLEKDEATPSR